VQETFVESASKIPKTKHAAGKDFGAEGKLLKTVVVSKGGQVGFPVEIGETAGVGVAAEAEMVGNG